MNKKKIEKIITHNIESNGDFNRIKEKINIRVYKKDKISFKDFILSKRVLRLVYPLLALAISIPFIPSFFKVNNTASSQTNIQGSQAQSTAPESSDAGVNNEAISSSSNSSQICFYLSSISVNGVIILNEDKKMFYTDETYGYYSNLNKDKEFTYTGIYEIEHLSNYNELNVNDKCYAEIVVDPGSSEFEINDIYELHVLESA